MTGVHRYLGTPLGTPPSRSLTGGVPEHLPDRLTICLWDFSWYTQAGPGEPYDDLDRAMRETAERGYNTVRICAAPLLLFGELGLDDLAGDLAGDLAIDGLGASATHGQFGQRTRWYNAAGGYRLNLRRRLFDLFDLARQHGVVVILSSWEYQQSPAFAESRRWFDALAAVPLHERTALLAHAWQRLLAALAAAGHTDSIALVELHNEVDFSLLPALQDGDDSDQGDATVLTHLRAAHPELIITASYGKPPHLAMHQVPDGLGAAQFHVYSYGVLDALQQRVDIRSEATDDFPNAALRGLLLTDAPDPEDYGLPQSWKLDATVVTGQMIYGYDWIDPQRWDAWLVEHYPRYAEVMTREIESRVIAVSAWARWKSIPAIVGEGWIGYTPLLASFEESPMGLELAEHGVRTALAHGVWGMVLCSNAAPHHPLWENIAWQQRVNALIRDGGPTPLSSADA